jgi:8-oxo-dGTP pyrophosphatase MutT (NUDIX family)
MTSRTSVIVGPSVTLTPCDAVAAIILVDDRYLLQLRDPKPDIFYPDHWGLFGGGIEPGESETEALLRELDEELRLVVAVEAVRRFTCLTFDFDFSGGPRELVRAFYELRLEAGQLDRLTVHEGREMRAMTAAEALDSGISIAPYDSFALWMHANREQITFPV